MTNNFIDVTALKESDIIYGNKGNVWSNTAHVYRSGVGNLCGTPALATNWARLEGVTVAGCPECVKRFKWEQKLVKS
jgi:hypothetical protein